MSKKIIIFSAVTYAIGVFSLAVAPNTYAGVRGRMNGASKPVDLGYVPGELLVRFAPKSDGRQRTRAERDQIVRSLGTANVTKDYGIVPGLSHVKLPAGVTVKEAMAQLNKRRDIIYAQPNHYLKLCGTFPNDLHGPKPAPVGGDQWGMYNIGQTVCEAGTPGAHINAPAAWDIETDASDIIVAVIDSGVDYTHEDLVNNMWTNPGEQEGDGNNDGRPGVKDVDDDGDGLIDEDSEGREPGDPGYTNDLVNDDDENGYNDDIYGIDLWDDDSNPMDEYLHGTSIAGTIGAEGNNGVGVTGVCWRVKIMALRLFNDNTHTGTENDAIDCIKYAVAMGARVINASWGRYDPEGGGRPPYGEPLRDAIEEAGKNGVLLIAAAENHGIDIDNEDPFYPASYDLDNIIGVMATDEHDERSMWDPPYSSNYGAVSVDLAAPGTCIWSCTLPYETEEGEVRYDPGEGTSVATPHVSGACALIWAINPTLSHLEVKGTILSTVDELESLKNDPQYGRLCLTGGRLNVGSAAEVAADYAPVFSVKDNDGERVAWFDNVGNLFVKGRLSQGPGTGQEMKGHWKFDEGSGQTAQDSVGGKHGTLQNMEEGDWVDGKIESALMFNQGEDNDERVRIQYGIEALKGTDVAVAAWVKADIGSTGKRAIVTQSNQSAMGCILGLNTGKPHFYLNSDNVGAEASEPITFDEWHHVAGTYDSDGEEISIYMDGHLEGTGHSYSWEGQDTDAYIAHCPVYPQNFKGVIDDVRVYNYALGAAEIWDLVFPNSNRFRVCNSSDETVAWFDDSGYALVQGPVHQRQSSLDPGSNETDDFVVKNTENDVVAFISDSGDLYLKGTLYEYEE